MLMEELEKAKTADAPPAEGVSPAAMASQVQFLQQQLQSAKLDNLKGPSAESVLSGAGMQDDLTRRLLAEIAKTPTAAGKATPGAQSSDGGVTYELFYKPEHAKFAQMATLGNLEQRIQKLESSLGQESLASVATDLGKPDITLQGAVTALTRQVMTLSTENLGDIERRVAQLLQQAEQLKKKAGEAAATQPSEYAGKVSELYELTKRWDATASCVPDLIERLQTLKGLHERGAEFGQTLTELEAVQSQIQESLRTQSSVLNTLNASFSQNLTTIQDNFKSLDARIDALTKNLARIK